MIRTVETAPAARRRALAPPPILTLDPLRGPGRQRDPIAAMAADIAEIIGAGRAVDEVALRDCGWSTAEIVEHVHAAVALARGAGPGDL